MQKNDQLTIFVKNSIPQSVLRSNPHLKTKKRDKHYHGYGTKIIRQTVEKYHGFVDYYEEGMFFCCNIIMYPQLHIPRTNGALQRKTHSVERRYFLLLANFCTYLPKALTIIQISSK
ncbi:MAG: GHKL domain-containing protein [Clostridia bacterium]|nr:GHKL domain-containing protein [Clostridia bacterium]